jgi:hypothetical protein
MTNTALAAGVVTLPGRCFELLHRNHGQHVELGDGTPHYPNRQAAEKAAEQIAGMCEPDMVPIDALERKNPCVTVIAQCGATFDDEVLVTHLDTVEEAQAMLQDYGWTLGADGAVFCDDTCCAEGRAAGSVPA